MLNKKVIILIILAGAVSFVLLILSIFAPAKPLPGSNDGVPVLTNSPAPLAQTQGVLSLSPDENTLLEPDESIVFVVKFAKSLSPNNIVVSLTRSDLGKDFDQEIQAKSVFSAGNSKVSISPEQVIIKSSRYSLVIKDISLNQVLLDRIFISRDLPQPIASNNPTLIPYLPYETPSFALIWDPTSGKYVFHFRYNNNDPDSPTTQFEEAKQAAIRFIKSKGIDPDKITIEWKYS